MYVRALEGREEAWGPKHTSTLDTVNNLGDFYRVQERFAKAQRMYSRALEGYANVKGDHEADINYLREHLLVLERDDNTAHRRSAAVLDCVSVYPKEPPLSLVEGGSNGSAKRRREIGSKDGSDRLAKVQKQDMPRPR